MKLGLFKALSLLMSMFVFAVHGADNKALHTQEEYFSMSKGELEGMKTCLEQGIKEAEEGDKLTGCCKASSILTGIGYYVALDRHRVAASAYSTCCLVSMVCASLGLAFAADQHPKFVTRSQRAELNKLEKALLKKLGEDEKQD